MFILFLVHANPNEKSHRPSLCELIMTRNANVVVCTVTVGQLITSPLTFPSHCEAAEGSFKITCCSAISIKHNRTHSIKKYRLVNVYLLDGSFEAVGESRSSCYAAVVRSSTDVQ